MKNCFVLVGITLVILFQLNCSPDEEQTHIENPVTDGLITGLNAAPLLGDVVLENMYEDEVRTLTDKTPLQIVTVLEGTSRVVLQARFRGVRDTGLGFPLYECELMDEAAEAMGGIAQGMSGSPVGPPGRIMGALAYGDSFAKTPMRFWVTPIDAMEATIDHQTFGEVLAQAAVPAAPGRGIHATHTPLKIPVMLTGIQSHRLQTFSSHLNADSRYNFVEFFAGIGAAPAAPPAGAARGLAAGDMIGVALVTGDVFNAFGFGTVTQVYDDKFVAFGHEALGVGHSALPVYRAITNGIVPSFANSYKSAAAYGSPIGTITKDLTPGIVGELGALPPMIPVDISYHPANSNTAIEKHHRVAYGHEALIATVAASTMGAIRMESGPGTVEGTVTLHFQETETVYTETFRSVSTSPSGDVLGNVSSIITSFTEMTINNAGKATLKAVSISITDKPQLASADVAEVIAPEEIIPGESVTVGITLLPHWSAAGAERTIQRKVTLEIPEDFPAGAATINVSGSGLDFFGGGLPKDSSLPPSGILDFNSFGEEEEKPVPKTLDELIKQLEKAQVDPGLITVTLSPSGFGDFPGLPLGLEPPEGLLPPEAGGMQEGGEEDGTGDDDGEMPEDGNADWDGDMEPPEPIEAELIIDGFVVTGSKDTTVMIKGEEMVDGMLPPMQDEAPMEPAEPVAKE